MTSRPTDQGLGRRAEARSSKGEEDKTFLLLLLATDFYTQAPLKQTRNPITGSCAVTQHGAL